MVTSESTTSVRAMIVCLALAGCDQGPDLSGATVHELIALAARVQKGEPATSPSHRAAAELSRRPDEAVTLGLLAEFRHEDAAVRGWSAQALAMRLMGRRKPLDARTHDEVEGALRGLLADRDEGVRASVLFALGVRWSGGRSETVPDGAADLIRALLASKDVMSRFNAAFAAMHFGAAVEGVAAQLVTQVKSESDSGVRMVMAFALGSAGAGYAPTADCLLALLDDPEEKVRHAAAGSLGDLRDTTPMVVDRLRRCLVNSAEATDVRTAAAVSLSEVAAKAEDVEALLQPLLDSQTLFEDYEQVRWVHALGKVAALVPKSPAGRAARERLEATALKDEYQVSSVATGGLARIACAERDLELGQRAADELRRALPEVLRIAVEEEREWSLHEREYCPVLEALVELSQWPEMKVDESELRPVFEALSKQELRWTRNWARTQAERLP